MSLADTGIKQPHIKHMQQAATDAQVHEMASNHDSYVHSYNNNMG